MVLAYINNRIFECCKFCVDICSKRLSLGSLYFPAKTTFDFQIHFQNLGNNVSLCKIISVLNSILGSFNLWIFLRFFVLRLVLFEMISSNYYELLFLMLNHIEVPNFHGFISKLDNSDISPATNPGIVAIFEYFWDFLYWDLCYFKWYPPIIMSCC